LGTTVCRDSSNDQGLVAQRYADLWRAIQQGNEGLRPPQDALELLDQIRNALDRNASTLYAQNFGRIANTFLVETVTFTSERTEVLHLRHIDLGTSHALKTLRPTCRDDIVIAQSLRREAETGLRFRHPNILETSALLRLEDGRPGLVMPWRPLTLASLSQEQLLDEREASTIVRSVLLALDTIHREGLVHCDVAPNNIFLHGDDFEQSLLGDFGIAIPIGSRHRDIGIKRAGSPEFAAPEQLQGEEAHPSHDIYAIGKLAEKLASKINAPRSIWSELIKQCCQLRPEDRPQSAREILDMISG
jgi:type VI secretion system protein ImpN